MIRNFRSSIDREKDYTTLEFLDLLNSQVSHKFPKSHKIILDSDKKTQNLPQRYSLDHNIQPKIRNRNVFDQSTTYSELPKQNGSAQKRQQLFRGLTDKEGTIVKRPVTSKQPQQHYRHTFDPVNRKRRVSQKILLKEREFIRPTIDKFCEKMAQSIIFNPNSEKHTPAVRSAHTGIAIIKKPGAVSLLKHQQLSNKSFKRIRFLGKGKFGQVHLVMHKETGFVCAMKVLSKKMIKQQKMEIPILREIKIHSQLRSMNIINFYGFFDDAESIYILLEYAVDGAMLSLLKDKTRLEENQIIKLIKGISDGVKHIHRMGYIHRDLKPENIVMSFGVPKICDFGWATNCDDFQLCKSYCGTPLYLSPQMIKKQLYGASVDIWTIGHLTYELLVGRVAFSIWNEKDLQTVLQKNVVIPEYIDRSQECQDFIKKALQKMAALRLTIDQILSHKFLQKQDKIILDSGFYRQTTKILTNNLY